MWEVLKEGRNNNAMFITKRTRIYQQVVFAAFIRVFYRNCMVQVTMYIFYPIKFKFPGGKVSVLVFCLSVLYVF